jgi:hypothetical protein
LKRGLLLLFVLGVGVPMSAADVVWTAIDVKAYLDNDGRYHVVETHHMRVEKGGLSLFREFGLGADQAIVLKRLVRVDADGTEHPLLDAEVGEDPNRYRYYDRGHAYYRVPELKQGGELAFRFEYDLVNAVAPVWGIAAGPGPLVEEPTFVKPWRRLGDIVADWREGQHDPMRRFRLEHDVLLPSREGPGYKLLNMDYRLEYETGWKRVRPEAEIATVYPDDHYRVRVLFEAPPQAAPGATSSREAGTRLAAVAALPVVGVFLWLLLLAAEALTARGLGPVSRELVAEQLLPLAPEELTRLAGEPLRRDDAEAVLSRLAAEGKIAVEVQPSADDERPPELRMRLLVSPASLPAFERAVLEPLFPEGQEMTSQRLREVYKEAGLDPGALVAGLLPPAQSPRSAARWSLVHLLTVPLTLLGIVLQFRALNHPDAFPLVVIANAVALLLTRAWPKGWWCTTRPARGLLVPLLLMIVGYLALHLTMNRPLPAQAWVGGALVVLACHANVLAGSRMRTGGAYTRLRHFARIRRFAVGELRRPNPRLEDAWTTRLEALGLRQEIARWRERLGGEGQLAPDMSSVAAADAWSGPRYTARVPEPFAGPAGWSEALYVYVDAGPDQDDDSSENEHEE